MTERFSVDGGGGGARPVPLRLGGAAKVDGSVRVLMGRATCVGPSSFFLFLWTRPLWRMNDVSMGVCAMGREDVPPGP